MSIDLTKIMGSIKISGAPNGLSATVVHLKDSKGAISGMQVNVAVGGPGLRKRLNERIATAANSAIRVTESLVRYIERKNGTRLTVFQYELTGFPDKFDLFLKTIGFQPREANFQRVKPDQESVDCKDADHNAQKVDQLTQDDDSFYVVDEENNEFELIDEPGNELPQDINTMREFVDVSEFEEQEIENIQAIMKGGGALKTDLTNSKLS